MISQTSKSQLFHTAFCMFLLHLVAVVGVCNGAPVASNGGATTAFELLFQSAFAPLASFFSPAPGTPTSYHEHISPIIALNKKSSGNQNDDEFHILPMPDNGKQIRFTTTTTTISSKKDGNSLDEVHILPIKEDFELPASEQGKSSSSGHGDHLQQKMPFNTESGLYQRLKNLGSSFQRLRGVRAHFEGGLWDDDVDAWMGEKHRLMLELEQDLLSRKDATLDQVHDIMGEPDTLQHFVDISGQFLTTSTTTSSSSSKLIDTPSIGTQCISKLWKSNSKKRVRVSSVSTLGKKPNYKDNNDGLVHILSKEEGVIHPMVLKKRGAKEEPMMSITCGGAYFEVYFYRGWHDYLWIYIENEQIVKHGWYYALE